VLKCIDAILYNFKFYNGASIKDVSYTLETGCGHTEKRGKAMHTASEANRGVCRIDMFKNLLFLQPYPSFDFGTNSF